MDNDDFNEPIEHEAEFFSIMEVSKQYSAIAQGGKGGGGLTSYLYGHLHIA